MTNSSSSQTLRIRPEPLRAFTGEVFRSLTLPAEDAALIARYLVEVDLRGVSSHGTRQLRRYVPEFRERRINPRPTVQQVTDTPVSAIFNGDGGAGYLAATQATEAVIAKAKVHGLAMAATRNHGHVGSEGIYARMALAHNLATFSVAGGNGWQKPTKPEATIWDAMRSPPMCFGVPTAEGPPLILDMNVNMLRDRSRLAEALETFPDFIFKSLGLRFVSTLLGGMLAGSAPDGEHDPRYSAAKRGFLIIAFDPAHAGDADAFFKDVARISAESRSLAPLPGLSSAELPGSLEWKRERTWASEGIPLTEAHRQILKNVSEELNIPLPWKEQPS